MVREMLFEKFQDGHHGEEKCSILSESASFAKARFFLLVDLRDLFSDLRLTGHFQSFFFSFSELFFLISPEQT